MDRARLTAGSRCNCNCVPPSTGSEEEGVGQRRSSSCPSSSGSSSRDSFASGSRTSSSRARDSCPPDTCNPGSCKSSERPDLSGLFGYDLDLDLDRAIEIIRRSGAETVGLQAPEGLKRAMPLLAEIIEEWTGARVIISGDPCFGACDVDLALSSEVDLMLHLGHAELGGAPENVIFLEARMDVDPKPVVEKAAGMLRAKKVGLASTIQHVHRLEEVVLALSGFGIEGVIGPAGGRVRHPGQVLGCSYATVRALVDVEEFLFIGTGRFHPLGIALATGKRVIAADPLTCEAFEIDPDPLLRRRFAAITLARRARRITILISKKPGQRRLALAERLRSMGKASGLSVSLVCMDNIEPDRLLNLGAEAAVCTACPRVALDDAAKYRIPILTPPEFEVLLGVREWERYEFDEIDEMDKN